MLMKLTLGLSLRQFHQQFARGLCTHQFSFHKKLQTQTKSREKQRKTLFHKKADHKMLVKLTTDSIQ
jgi:hypothetical protein